MEHLELVSRILKRVLVEYVVSECCYIVKENGKPYYSINIASASQKTVSLSDQLSVKSKLQRLCPSPLKLITVDYLYIPSLFISKWQLLFQIETNIDPEIVELCQQLTHTAISTNGD